MLNSEMLKGNMITLVLKLLQKKEMYGYEIAKDLGRLSGGNIDVKEGTLYPILHSLETDGAVESYWSQEPGERKRKYYRITKTGRALLKEKSNQWETFKSAIDQVLATKRVGI